jgi:spoIIIJ-associated protein
MKEEKLKKTIEELLSKIPISFSTVTITTQNEEIEAKIESEEAELLIGSRGATLQALTHLVRRMLEKEEGAMQKILLDVNSYRKREAERIKEAAKILGERALSFKHEVEMEPMGAYERLLVHSVFAEHPNLKTESRGEGPFRKVVICYVENK